MLLFLFLFFRIIFSVHFVCNCFPILFSTAAFAKKWKKLQVVSTLHVCEIQYLLFFKKIAKIVYLKVKIASDFSCFLFKFGLRSINSLASVNLVSKVFALVCLFCFKQCSRE